MQEASDGSESSAGQETASDLLPNTANISAPAPIVAVRVPDEEQPSTPEKSPPQKALADSTGVRSGPTPLQHASSGVLTSVALPHHPFSGSIPGDPVRLPGLHTDNSCINACLRAGGCFMTHELERHARSHRGIAAPACTSERQVPAARLTHAWLRSANIVVRTLWSASLD